MTAQRYSIRSSGIEAYTSIPDDALVRHLTGGFKEFIASDGTVFHQVDLASYLFVNKKLIWRISPIRHPHVLVANSNSPTGSFNLEISSSSYYGKHFSIDEYRKPRSKPEARGKLNVHGFKRKTVCYTSAKGDTIKSIIQRYQTVFGDYSITHSNCVHFTAMVLETLCGRRVAARFRRQFFISHDILRLLPGKTTKKGMKIIYIPHDSTKGSGDKRTELTLDGVERLWDSPREF